MSDLLECPCCHGEGYLNVYDPELNVDGRMICCHCSGYGMIAFDNRSVNAAMVLKEKQS